MEVSPADPESICRLISSHRYHFANELVLQDGIAAVLDAAGIAYSREHILTPKRRIDFLGNDLLGSPSDFVIRP